MPALGMSHVAFCVRDMEKSLAFYQEALGFRGLQDRRQDTTTGQQAYEQKYRDRVLTNLQRKAKAFGYQLVHIEDIDGGVASTL